MAIIPAIFRHYFLKKVANTPKLNKNNKLDCWHGLCSIEDARLVFLILCTNLGSPQTKRAVPILLFGVL